MNQNRFMTHKLMLSPRAFHPPSNALIYRQKAEVRNKIWWEGRGLDNRQRLWNKSLLKMPLWLYFSFRFSMVFRMIICSAERTNVRRYFLSRVGSRDLIYWRVKLYRFRRHVTRMTKINNNDAGLRMLFSHSLKDFIWGSPRRAWPRPRNGPWSSRTLKWHTSCKSLWGWWWEWPTPRRPRQRRHSWHPPPR